MRKTVSVLSIVIGVIMAIAGVVTWIVVTTTLSDQNITVSDDANCMAGHHVQDPLSAYCQARVIDKHTREITGGKTYAELAQDDPVRQTAMDSAFLQASLFTSVVAYGVAAMAVVIGLLFALIGVVLLQAPKPAGDGAHSAAYTT
jgi:ABC-type sugar transport system permease subunit